MAKNQLISIVDYLRLGSTVHEEHLNKIRDTHQQVINQMSAGTNKPDILDKTILQEIARRLNIRFDTDETEGYLCDCVRYGDINLTKTIIGGKFTGAEEPLIEIVPVSKPISNVTAAPPPLLSSPSIDATDNGTSLDKIKCVLNIKMNIPEVQTFIQSFLLQKINKPENIGTGAKDTPAEKPIRHNEQSALPKNCLLDLFVRQQLLERGTITTSGRQNSTHFRLIEPINMTDDFGPWQYDHWHGLFDLVIEPYNNKVPFPARWYLADNANIYCRLSDNDSPVQTLFSSVNDKPRTTSLHVFIKDVCAREDNGQTKAWLTALQAEDILTYEHLANLNQSEWEKITRLSMHAKKTLKAAIDQERVNVTNKRYQKKQPDSDNPKDLNDKTLPNNTEGEPSYSQSEILANLHLIKLFLWHSLRNDSRIQQYGTLPRLESECLNKAFSEMQNEGFADDGLFPRIQEFFYSLTISEYEIRRKKQINSNGRSTNLTLRDQLRLDIKRLMNQVNEQAAIFWDFEYKCNLLQEKRHKAQTDYVQERKNIQSKFNNKQQQSNAQALQQQDRRWQQTQLTLNGQIKNLEQSKNDASKKKHELEKKLEEDEKNLKNIENELAHPRQKIDKQLVKPARGLIMYGPPGTGKSRIMSQLAKKLGVLMLSEPLAAGELNRSYVGESERILIALCTRAHRVPYAMCCLSIDEIDSLAPKRDEDSSEGKIDKISVLLSLIEGIKDVPNLMILCATNRLHMMDEAFLRRMSGKFFVGRPSPKARSKMLEKIPDWALKLHLINRLQIATTNFSGAAVIALTQAITVKAMVTQRNNPAYEIDEGEALKITDRTAQQFQIFIGSETLPRLFLRNLSSNSENYIENLSATINYTGRIVIDLHSGYVRIEIHTQTKKNENDDLSIIEQELNSNEINVQTLLERLSIYGGDRNVQLLQLIDLNLLAAQGAYDEKKVFETLKDRYDECSAYTRSMIIYDLDALVGVNKSESDSNMGRSTSSSVVNANIYTYIRARFRDCALEKKSDKQQESDQIERWAVAIIREPFLLRQFCADVQFSRTPEEEAEMELERHKSEDQLKCVKCKDFYIENENKMGNCVHHDGFIYDNSAADLEQFTPSVVVKKLNRIESDILNNPERRDELERQKTKFKWICCDATFASGSGGGCKKSKHGFSASGNDDEDLNERYGNGRADRLDQKTIEKWEKSCLDNKEYNEKWLLLFDDPEH